MKIFGHVFLASLILYVFIRIIYRMIKFARNKNYGAVKAQLLLLFIEVLLATFLIYMEMSRL